MTVTAPFKYTFPITKSEERADGRYLVGYASGPEIDSEGERMSPEAIERFAIQINESGGTEEPLVYRDAHAPDGVLRDLGVITKAWVNEHFHLGIEVRLDDDNPASDFLWKSVRKGKQFGMSVSGRVLDYADEFVEAAGSTIRTYKNVVLDEISNTTRPAWYPSFGSVLSKSVKDAAQSAGSTGVTTLEKDTLLDTTVEETTESTEAIEPVVDETDKAADEAVEPVEADAEVAEKSEEDEPVADEAEVDKAGRSISSANRRRLVGLYQEMTSTLKELGILEDTESEKSDSTDEEDTLDKSAEDTADDGLAALVTQVEALTKANAEQAARIAELEKAPRTPLPSAITDEAKKSQDEELSEILRKASPSDRLRIALALQTQGK